MLEKLLTWNNLGLLLTALGTLLTCWQSYKAKTYKDEIKADRANLALYELIPKGLHARDECKKIKTPLDPARMPRGVSSEAVINTIEEFYEILQVNQHRLSNSTEISNAMSKLKDDLGQYRRQTAINWRFSIADRIYNHLNSINTELAKLRDG